MQAPTKGLKGKLEKWTRLQQSRKHDQDDSLHSKTNGIKENVKKYVWKEALLPIFYVALNIIVANFLHHFHHKFSSVFYLFDT